MDSEIVAFPDAEAVAVQFLKTQFTLRGESAKVATKVPNLRPNRLVRVSRAGGPQRNKLLDAPLLIFQCWDVSEVAAASLGRLTRALVGAMPGEFVGTEWVSDVTEVGGLTSYPDPDTDLPRYQFTVELLIEGSAI